MRKMVELKTDPSFGFFGGDTDASSNGDVALKLFVAVSACRAGPEASLVRSARVSVEHLTGGTL